MHSNKLTVCIHQPISVVFDFTIDPKNTSKWIESIEEEKVNEWPVRMGSIYQNKNSTGRWVQYTVLAIMRDKFFELIAADKNYHVRYTYSALNDAETKMEYLEWVVEGELADPFTQDTLNTLKSILET